jgi:hypothetical protein
MVCLFNFFFNLESFSKVNFNILVCQSLVDLRMYQSLSSLIFKMALQEIFTKVIHCLAQEIENGWEVKKEDDFQKLIIQKKVSSMIRRTLD